MFRKRTIPILIKVHDKNKLEQNIPVGELAEQPLTNNQQNIVKKKPCYFVFLKINTFTQKKVKQGQTFVLIIKK